MMALPSMVAPAEAFTDGRAEILETRAVKRAVHFLQKIREPRVESVVEHIGLQHRELIRHDGEIRLGVLQRLFLGLRVLLPKNLGDGFDGLSRNSFTESGVQFLPLKRLLKSADESRDMSRNCSHSLSVETVEREDFLNVIHGALDVRRRRVEGHESLLERLEEIHGALRIDTKRSHRYAQILERLQIRFDADAHLVRRGGNVVEHVTGLTRASGNGVERQLEGSNGVAGLQDGTREAIQRQTTGDDRDSLHCRRERIERRREPLDGVAGVVSAARERRQTIARRGQRGDGTRRSGRGG
jgi:hypothetical protein